MLILSYVLGSCRRPWAPRQPRSQAPEVALDTRPPCLASLAVLVALAGLVLNAVRVLETSKCLLVWVPPTMYLICAPQSRQSLCCGPDRAPSVLVSANVTHEAAEGTSDGQGLEDKARSSLLGDKPGLWEGL